MSITKWVGECLRKKRLNDNIADEVIARAKKEGTALYKYHCPHCDGWHITKMKNHEAREFYRTESIL